MSNRSTDSHAEIDDLDDLDELDELDDLEHVRDHPETVEVTTIRWALRGRSAPGCDGEGCDTIYRWRGRYWFDTFDGLDSDWMPETITSDRRAIEHALANHYHDGMGVEVDGYDADDAYAIIAGVGGGEEWEDGSLRPAGPEAWERGPDAHRWAPGSPDDVEAFLARVDRLLGEEGG